MRDEQTGHDGGGDHLKKVVEIVEVVEILELVEIEEYGAKNVKPPKAKKYRIRIDKKKFDVPKPHISGGELLRLAEKDPTRCAIRQKFHGGQVKTIGLDDTVDLTAPGVERFMTLCHDQTDG